VYNKTVYSGKDRKHTAPPLIATDAMVTGQKMWDTNFTWTAHLQS